MKRLALCVVLLTFAGGCKSRRPPQDLYSHAVVLLSSSEPSDREMGAGMLAGLGARGADRLEKELQSPDPAHRKMILKQVARMGPEAVPALRSALRDPDWDIRTDAAKALTKHRGDAKAAVPELVAAVAITQKQSGLGEERLKKLKGVDALAEVFSVGVKMAELQIAAGEALAAIGPEALEPLVAALTTEDLLARAAVARALCGFGDPAFRHVEKALRQGDATFRGAVMGSLGGLGPPAIPLILEFDRDLPFQNALAGTTALREIGSPAADALRLRLKHTAPAERIRACDYLAWFPQFADAIASDLKPVAMKDPEKAVRKAAKEALEALQQWEKLFADPEFRKAMEDFARELRTK